MAQTFIADNSPEWIKDGRMTKKLFNTFSMLKTPNLFIENYLNADVMIKSIEQAYEPILQEYNDKINNAITSNNARLAKKYALRTAIITEEYDFLINTYSLFKDVVFTGFDYTVKLSSFLTQIEKAVSKKIPISSLPFYKELVAINEHLLAAHITVFYATEIEEMHKKITNYISSSPWLESYEKSQILDNEDYYYYHKMREIKHDWGCMSSSLKRATDSMRPLNVLDYKKSYEIINAPEKDVEIVDENTGRNFYSLVVNEVKFVKTLVRQKENKVYAEDKGIVLQNEQGN